MRTEFVRSNAVAGDPKHPTKKLYFKILPRGAADVPGVLLGFPALDVPPYGLGWQTKEGGHYFSDLHVLMPRAELKKRGAHAEAVKRWHADDRPKGNFGMDNDQCNLLKEACMKESLLQVQESWIGEEVCACYMGEPLVLELPLFGEVDG